MTPTAGHRDGQNYTYQDPTTGDQVTVIGGTLKIDGDEVTADELSAALGVDGLTASVDDLNLLDGATIVVSDITATADEVNTLTGEAGGGTIGAPSAEAANARTLAVQVNDRAGAAMAARVIVTGFVSTDANGDSPGDGSATITVTAGTDGAIISTDESGFTAITEADGDLDLVLTDGADATANVYLHLMLGGVLVHSAIIAFADDTP